MLSNIYLMLVFFTYVPPCESFEACKELAREANKQQDFRLVAMYLNSASMHKQDERVFFLLGRVYFELGDYEQSIVFFNESSALTQDITLAQTNALWISRCHVKLKNIQLALQHFHAVTKTGGHLNIGIGNWGFDLSELAKKVEDEMNAHQYPE